MEPRHEGDDHSGSYSMHSSDKALTEQDGKMTLSYKKRVLEDMSIAAKK